MSSAQIPFDNAYEKEQNVLDQYIAPGLRLWMLLGMILGVLLAMTIVICCLIKIRIPRTKREIEVNSAKRKNKKPSHHHKEKSSRSIDLHNYQSDRSGKVIVMSSIPTAGSLLPPPSDVETASCNSCETSEETRMFPQSHDPSPSGKDKDTTV